MATTTSSLSDRLQCLLKISHPSTTLDPASPPSKTSTSLFPETTYTDAEKQEIDTWTASANHLASGSDDAAKSAERLATLNRHLSTRTTMLGSKPSVADVAVYAQLAPEVSRWTAEERTGAAGYHHIVRHVDFVQKSGVFGLRIPEAELVRINPDEVISPIKPVDAKAEKERKKREKEAAAAAAAGPAAEAKEPKGVTDKVKDVLEAIPAAVGANTPMTNSGAPKEKKAKEKAPKQPKPQKAPAVEKPLSPSLIDLRVGHILKAIAHPNADSLYVSTIAVGDPAGTDNTSEYEGQVCRTVCSGLNGKIPLEEMQGRKIIAVCNLKPVTMRGIKSCAMVLAASPRVAEGEDDHAGPVELVNPPEGAAAGERVYFDGWEGEPEAVLNPKKKIFETLQPGLTTTDGLEVGFDVDAVEQLKASGKTGVALLRTKEGLCGVKKFKGAAVR